MSKVAVHNARTIAKKVSRTLPILDGETRLTALRQIRGMWKNRTPDPIKEFSKIRREWDRKLS